MSTIRERFDPHLFSFGDAVERALADMLARADGKKPTVTTGSVALDHKLGGGFEPQSLVTIGARPRMGKTALALQFAKHAANEATRAGHPVLFYSLEVPASQLGRRLLAGEAGLPYALFRNPTHEALAEHRDQLRAAAQRIKDLRMAKGVDVRLTVDELCEYADAILPKDGPCPVVIVDYLQRLREPEDRRRESRERIVAEQAIRLKEFANARRAVVMVGAQLNRGSTSRAESRPTLEDLRESGAIEQESDVVMLLHRPHLYDATKPARLLEVLLPKQREAESGVACKIDYDTERQRFADWDDKMTLDLRGDS